MEQAKDKVIEQMVAIIKDDAFQKEVVKAINNKFDIPIINEKKEREVFNAVYDVLERILVKEIRKMDI